MKTTLCLLPLLLVGCASDSPTVVHIVQTPQATAKPWTDGHATTYWVGRTTAGSDGNVLHEAHAVYRREDAGRPQLAPPYEILAPATAPAPTTNMLFEQFESQRAEAARAREAITRLLQASKEVSEQADTMKAMAETSRQLQRSLPAVNEQLSVLSNRVVVLEQSRSSESLPRATNSFSDRPKTNEGRQLLR